MSKLIFKHTPGPWTVKPEHGMHIINFCGKFTLEYEHGVYPDEVHREEINANVHLMSYSLGLLQTLLDQYIWLQTEVQKDLNNGSATMAVKSDAQRAALRNAISAASGIQCEEIQNYVEGVAHEKARS